jgi:hypothetical protein
MVSYNIPTTGWAYSFGYVLLCVSLDQTCQYRFVAEISVAVNNCPESRINFAVSNFFLFTCSSSLNASTIAAPNKVTPSYAEIASLDDSSFRPCGEFSAETIPDAHELPKNQSFCLYCGKYSSSSSGLAKSRIYNNTSSKCFRPHSGSSFAATAAAYT